MQMHDTLRRVESGSIGADLAEAFDIASAQADAVLRVVGPELAWALESNTLSRAGLAALVEAIGSGNHARHLDGGNVFRNAAAMADGQAILGHLLGSRDASRTLAARAAWQSGVDEDRIRAMLPGLAAVTMAALDARARVSLGPILDRMPSLGRFSRGSAHADLADILRRRCGGRPYGPAKLRRVVRRAIAQATGFAPRGALRWYLQFMLVRPAARLISTVMGRFSAAP